MSDVSQIQQSHPSSHQLVLWPCVCARCWIDAAGTGIPLVHELPANRGLWKWWSFVTSALLRRNPSLTTQKTLCSLLASNSPGVTRSCTSRRCNCRVCLEVKSKTLANAGSDSHCITRKAVRWKLISASSLIRSSDRGLCSVWLRLNQSVLTSLNSFPSLLTKACLTFNVGWNDAGQEFKNKIWEALQAILFWGCTLLSCTKTNPDTAFFLLIMSE